MFNIKFNKENGGVDFLSHSDDVHKMNWVDGTATWGTLKIPTPNFYTWWDDLKQIKTERVQECENGICAVYKTFHLRVTVKRTVEGEIYKERYEFENATDYDVFIKRGDIGIYTTFNDGYSSFSQCMNQRCHTHIWCGMNSSYINAIKMGISDKSLALVLTEGSLDSYSTVNCDAGVSDRGDFILHPSPCRIPPKGKMCIEWEMFFYPDGEFEKNIEKYPNVLLFDTDNYTYFMGENIVFSANRENAEIFLGDKKISSVSEDGKTKVCYTPTHTGNHTFTVKYGDGLLTKAEFYVQIPFKELAEKRAKFIVQKQQFNCSGSALDGAYLIYDNEENSVFFDGLYHDFNASRERLVMGIFLAKYLQYNCDKEIYDSLLKYYRFVTREFYDEETGEVFNTVGKDPSFKRLYNAPWMSVFTLEMYNLTGDDTYLDKMYKLLSVYYSIGGEKFYPNGLSMLESVEALQKAGKREKAENLLNMYRKHVEQIVSFGTNYPEHEVKYEQTIVTAAVLHIAQMYMLTKDEKLLNECKLHVKILERFNGHQPSHYLNDLAIRYWDGYCFGKRQIFGDTFPHPASVHTSNGFLHYAIISGDEKYLKRAVCGARNNLSLFREDGSANCTRIHPFSVNGHRGEFYDEFADEQDGFLYYMIKYFHMLD